MNFYKRHLGDYAKDAGHLSMLEHGAYTLLLDRYYTTEQPIPSLTDAYRICRARSRDEKAAVDTVLKEFFSATGETYTNKRAQSEIAKADHQRAVNREIGKRGGRPKQTEQITESVSESDTEPEPNHNPSQTPDSRQEQKQKQKQKHASDSSNQTARAGPSAAGRACVLMREAGCPITNPGHPDLLAALAAGVTPESLAHAAAEAIALGKTKPFPWAIATARGRHDEARNPPPRGNRDDRPRESLADRAARRAADIFARTEGRPRQGPDENLADGRRRLGPPLDVAAR